MRTCGSSRPSATTPPAPIGGAVTGVPPGGSPAASTSWGDRLAACWFARSGGPTSHSIPGDPGTGAVAPARLARDLAEPARRTRARMAGRRPCRMGRSHRVGEWFRRRNARPADHRRAARGRRVDPAPGTGPPAPVLSRALAPITAGGERSRASSSVGESPARRAPPRARRPRRPLDRRTSTATAVTTPARTHISRSPAGPVPMSAPAPDRPWRTSGSPTSSPRSGAVWRCSAGPPPTTRRPDRGSARPAPAEAV
jgi:hypothetical protein